jgi:hypothetical protein
MTVKQPRKSSTTIRSILYRAIAAAAFTVLTPAVASGSPLFLAGTSISLDVISPTGGETTFDIYAGGDLSLGLRGILAQDGHYSFAARIEAAIHKDLLFSDSEYLNLLLNFRAWSVEAGLLATLIDDGSGSAYANPSLNVTAGLPVLSDTGDISFSYAGYLTYLPKDAEDFIYQGIHATCRINPSIFFGYEFTAGGGWEYHYEQVVYERTGEPRDVGRHDLVLDGSVGIDGFVGYFTEWAVSTAVSWRKSNAAFPVEEDFFLDHPEDRLQVAVDAGIFTSPHQSLTLDATIFTDGTWYVSRPARVSDDRYGEDDFLLLDIGASARGEWTPNQRIYVALNANFGYSLSNDPFVGGWYASSTLSLTF